MHALKPEDLVRGQFEGYLQEPGVAKDSDTETYCALRLFIDSWRWAGVPWYLRSGKCLAETAAEILVQLKAPPQKLFEDAGPDACRANYLRFQLSPHPVIALAARVKRAGEEYIGDQKELIYSTLSQMSKHLMSGCWVMHWRVTVRFSPGRMQLNRLGQFLIGF